MAIIGKAKETVKSLPVVVAAGIAAAVVLGVGLVKLGLFNALVHDRWLPEILVGLALIVFLLIIFIGLPWYRERSFVRRLDSGYQVGGEQSPEEFQAKFAAAMRRFRNLPQHSGKGNSTYALPWFLMMGAAGCGKTAAIKEAGIFSTLTSITSEHTTTNCDWWVSNSMLLLDTSGRYTIPSEVERDRGEWYRLLRLVKYHHGQEPLSGIVIAIAADYLASQSEEKIRSDGGQVRERIEEAIRELELDFPVYFLITKCDLIEGFAEFFGALPIRVLNQAVGWVDDPPAALSGGPPRGRALFQRLANGLESTYQRLAVLGTSVLNGKVAEGLRQPLFCFPEEWRALERRLSIFLEVLVNEDVRYHTPFIRGVFLSSAAQQGPRTSFIRSQLPMTSAPAPSDGKPQSRYFLCELFETILPRDRALASALTSKVA